MQDLTRLHHLRRLKQAGVVHAIQRPAFFGSLFATPAQTMDIFNGDAEGHPLQGMNMRAVKGEEEVIDFTVALCPWLSVLPDRVIERNTSIPDHGRLESSVMTYFDCFRPAAQLPIGVSWLSGLLARKFVVEESMTAAPLPQTHCSDVSVGSWYCVGPTGGPGQSLLAPVDVDRDRSDASRLSPAPTRVGALGRSIMSASSHGPGRQEGAAATGQLP